MLRICIVLTCLASVQLVGLPAHAAAPPDAVLVSGETPLDAAETCSVDHEQPATAAPDHESEPVVAVDPRDPRHLVAAWAQDGERGIVTAYSRNSGVTWSTPAPVAGLSSCTGGEFPYVTHPHIAFGTDSETVYLAAFARHLTFGVRAQTLVSRSTDGGETWTLTARPDLPALDVANDFDSFTVAPDTGELFVVGSAMELNFLSEVTLLSRSVDGGQTWTRSVVRTAAPGTSSWSALLALPQGRLLLAYFDSPLSEFVAPSAVAVSLSAVFSDNKGLTWSLPRTIGAGAAVQWPRADVGPDGAVHVAWVRSAGNGTCTRVADGGTCEVAVSSSKDAGDTWSTPRSLPSWNGKWMPSPGVAAGPDGAVTVVHTHPDDEGTGARVLLSTSVQGSAWETTDFGAVDLAQLATGGDLGLFQGADAGECGVFGAAVRTEGARNGTSDVFILRSTRGASECTR